MTAPIPSPAPAPSTALAQGGGGGWLKWIYLGLAVAGAILPWLANWEFIRIHGAPGDLGLFLRLAGANPAALSLSRDLAIGATAVTIWMVSESRRLSMRGLAWVLLSCLTIAFAFGAPLFLYLRERRLEELSGQKTS
jgi:hypothetical protein